MIPPSSQLKPGSIKYVTIYEHINQGMGVGQIITEQLSIYLTSCSTKLPLMWYMSKVTDDPNIEKKLKSKNHHISDKYIVVSKIFRECLMCYCQ